MESHIFVPRCNGRHDTNFMLRREYPICLTGQTNTSYRNNIQNLSRFNSPLQDITGSIFGGLIHESRNRSFNESNYFTTNDRNMVYNEINPRFNRIRNRNFERNINSRFNRNTSNFNNRRSNIENDIRIINRSLSMSSQNIEYRINSLNDSNEMIENNSSYMNRSRSFADRILDQFEALEREHNHLTERMQRSQSIYEQIRNNDNINNLLHDISRRMERRRYTQGNYNTRLNNFENRSHTTTNRRNINTRIRNNESRFSSFQELNNIIHNRTLTELHIEPETEDEDENEIFELIEIDDDDLSNLMLRRNQDIRNRSFIINHNEIIEDIDNQDIYQNQNQQDLVSESDHIEDEVDDSLDSNSRNETNLNNIGLPIEIQHTLPISIFNIQKSQNLDHDKKTCLICLEEFKDKQEILWLPCTHCFCKDCIISWFKRGTVCPICKDDILAHFQE